MFSSDQAFCNDTFAFELLGPGGDLIDNLLEVPCIIYGRLLDFLILFDCLPKREVFQVI